MTNNKIMNWKEFQTRKSFSRISWMVLSLVVVVAVVIQITTCVEVFITE